MANLLNFKMGLKNSLTATNPAVAPGTIYVTTDERAMYIDVTEKDGTNARRIRLGDFRVYATFEDLKKEPADWTQSCLYYVVDKNALAYYAGADKGWKLINDTAELSSNIENLTTAFGGIVDRLDGLGTSKGDVKKYIDTADQNLGLRIDEVENRATALESAVGKKAEGQNAATGLFKEVDDVEARVESLEGFITGGEGSLSDVIATEINKLDAEVSSAEPESGKGIQVTVKQVDGKLTEVALAGNFDEKYEAKGVGQAAANKVLEDLTTAINKVDSDYKAADVLINAKLDGIDTTVVAAINAAKNAAISSANGHADDLVSELKGGSTKTIKQLADEIAGNDSDIENLQAAVGTSGLGGRVSNLETTVNETIPATYETKENVSKNLQTAKDYSDANLVTAKGYTDSLANGQVKDNKEAIENLQTAVGATGLGGRVTALESKVDVTKVSEAISAAEQRAALDATAKANAAEANAKTAVKQLEEGAVAQNASAIQNLQTALSENGSVSQLIDNKINTKVQSLDATKSNTVEDGKGIQVTVSQVDGLLDSVVVSGNFDKVYDSFGSASAVEGKLNTARENLTSAINTVSGKVDTEKGRIDGILNDKLLDSFADVRAFVASSIAANDAMVFKGVVTLDTGKGLPASGMENGDTYKVGATGAYNVGGDKTENAKIGDLFIYDGTAEEWRLIPSGGEDYVDPALSSTNNIINLTSGVTSQNIGNVTIEGGNELVKVAGNGANKIAISLEWGTF